MHKIPVLILILLTVFISASADKFRNEKFPRDDNDGTEFILPPKSKLKFKNGETLESKYRYHIATFRLSGNDYSVNLTQIDNVRYDYEKEEEISATDEKVTLYKCQQDKDPIFSKVEITEDDNSGGGKSKGGKPGEKVQILKIQLNYEVLFTDCKDKIPEAFNQTAVKLMSKLAQAEDLKLWASNICVLIVDKLFDLIPSPNAASFARFGYLGNGKRVVMLLSPKFTLRVDLAVKTQLPGENFRYDFIGQAHINIFRKTSNGKIVPFIEQRPFLSVGKSLYPENTYDENAKLVILANSGDIQLSSSINGKKFIAFYEGTLKRNNSIKGDDARNDEIYRQNSFLLFSNNPDDFYENDNTDVPPSKPLKAVYGERSLITPLISISINDQILQVPFNTTLLDLIQSGKIVRKNKLFRIWGKKIYKFAKPFPGLVLLPGDSIEF